MNKENILEVKNVHKRFTSKGITVKDIPNEEREDEGNAIIYGSDYDYLADRFAAIIAAKAGGPPGVVG